MSYKPLVAFFKGTAAEYEDLSDLAPSYIRTAAMHRNTIADEMTMEELAAQQTKYGERN